MYELQAIQMKKTKEEIRCCEDLNKLYGLSLSEADITELVEFRVQALKQTGRVEFGGGVLPKLIRAFCRSSYIDPQSYAQTLGELQDAFYYFKNESGDRFSDDDLIEFMEQVFNGIAHGSTDILTTISLEELCRWARNGFDGHYTDEEAFY